MEKAETLAETPVALSVSPEKEKYITWNVLDMVLCLEFDSGRPAAKY